MTNELAAFGWQESNSGLLVPSQKPAGPVKLNRKQRRSSIRYQPRPAVPKGGVQGAPRVRM